MAAVHEIHAAHERDIVGGSGLAANDHKLLVMATATSDAIVEEHFTSRGVHGAGEHEILLLGIWPAVRPPHEPANLNTPLSQISEHLGHFGTGTRESLVGVTFKAGQEDRIAGLGRTQHRIQPGEVLAAVDEDLREVPFGPGDAVVATVDRAVGVPPLLGGEKPVTDTHVSSVNLGRVTVDTGLRGDAVLASMSAGEGSGGVDTVWLRSPLG